MNDGRTCVWPCRQTGCDDAAQEDSIRFSAGCRRMGTFLLSPSHWHVFLWLGRWTVANMSTIRFSRVQKRRKKRTTSLACTIGWRDWPDSYVLEAGQSNQGEERRRENLVRSSTFEVESRKIATETRRQTADLAKQRPTTGTVRHGKPTSKTGGRDEGRNRTGWKGREGTHRPRCVAGVGRRPSPPTPPSSHRHSSPVYILHFMLF